MKTTDPGSAIASRGRRACYDLHRELNCSGVSMCGCGLARLDHHLSTNLNLTLVPLGSLVSWPATYARKETHFCEETASKWTPAPDSAMQNKGSALRSSPG